MQGSDNRVDRAALPIAVGCNAGWTILVHGWIVMRPAQVVLHSVPPPLRRSHERRSRPRRDDSEALVCCDCIVGVWREWVGADAGDIAVDTLDDTGGDLAVGNGVDIGIEEDIGQPGHLRSARTWRSKGAWNSRRDVVRAEDDMHPEGGSPSLRLDDSRIRSGRVDLHRRRHDSQLEPVPGPQRDRRRDHQCSGT